MAMRGGFQMKRKIAYACAVFVVSHRVCAPAGRAWGCRGHETVAALAEKHLTPEAKQALLTLLTANPIDPQLKRFCGDTGLDPIVDAATWADDERTKDPATAPWHFIDIPLGATTGSAANFCGTGGCVTKAITEQLAILKDKTAAGAKRAAALRFIIHFVGDLHQPLHGADAAEFANTLDSMFAGSFAEWQAGGMQVENWAWESHQHAADTAYGALGTPIAVEPDVPVNSCADDNNIGQRMLHKHIVAGTTYRDQAASVAEERLAQAGIRLAMILNDAAKSGL